MTQIIFRDLPAVARVERQLDMQFRDRLWDDDIEDLPYLIDDASFELFGITLRDTFYWGLPASVRGNWSRAEWEANFDLLGRYSRDPNEHWRVFDLDLRCEKGRGLRCFEVFGRQLICACHGLHPQALLVFAGSKSSLAA